MKTKLHKQLISFISGLVLLVNCNLYAQPNLNAGLIAHYPLNGNAADVSGHNFNASVLQSQYVDDRFSNANNALDCEVTNDIALIPAQVFENFTQGTISFWVKTTESGTNTFYYANPCLFGYDNDGYNDSAFNITTSYGKIQMWGQLHTQGKDDEFNSQLSINDNKWHFILVKINDNNSCKLYVDNNYIGSIPSRNPFAKKMFAVMGSATIYPNHRTDVHKGFVDDVRIYNRILSDCEMDALYYPPSDTGLIAHYPLNGNGNDVSGHAFNADVSLLQTQYVNDRNSSANSALDCQVTNDITLIPAQVFNNFTKGTISFWVKTTESGTNTYYYANPCLFGYDNDGYNDSAFNITTSNGKIQMWGQLNTPGKDDKFNSQLSINDNQWHFILAKINDNDSCKLYVDNSYIGSIPAGYPLAKKMFAVMGSATIYPNHRTDVHKGFIDDVRIYNTILSNCETQKLYTSVAKYNVSQLDNVKFYPNPVESVVTLEGLKNQQYYASIYNLMGMKVWYGKIDNNSIAVPDLASGMYFIKLQNEKNEELKAMKFCKY